MAPPTFPSPFHEKTEETSPTETSQLYARLGSAGPVIEMKKPWAIRAAATTPIKMYVSDDLLLFGSLEMSYCAKSQEGSMFENLR